jgi:hypothetical protein
VQISSIIAGMQNAEDVERSSREDTMSTRRMPRRCAPMKDAAWLR